jgi:FK506-binding protein 2
MKSTVLVLALASLAAASAELKIDVTRKVKCERKTQKGDQVKMHYHGSLESNGEKFDASMS